LEAIRSWNYGTDFPTNEQDVDLACLSAGELTICSKRGCAAFRAEPDAGEALAEVPATVALLRAALF
jgi:hypothetical protein